jgi:hypothetical protein
MVVVMMTVRTPTDGHSPFPVADDDDNNFDKKTPAKDDRSPDPVDDNDDNDDDDNDGDDNDGDPQRATFD